MIDNYKLYQMKMELLARRKQTLQDQLMMAVGLIAWAGIMLAVVVAW